MMPLFRLISSLRRTRRGVALIQVVLVIALIAVLSSIGIPTYTRARAVANRNRCDVQLKAIALALDAYRQAHGHLPTRLDDLRTEEYLKDASQFHCPCDPREKPSYQDYYVLRSRDDGAEIPVLMCPFHENIGGGNQARIGLYTTQFATRPAQLEAANAVEVETPGQEPRTGYAGMALHGGDLVHTGDGGAATIAFADGSTAKLKGATDVTVLQSFIDGHQDAPLYTVLRQTTGSATYKVHHGSHFDVTTPTATAGARGTEFVIDVTNKQDLAGATISKTTLTVNEGKVAFTGGKQTVMTTAGHSGSVLGKLIGGILGGLFG